VESSWSDNGMVNSMVYTQSGVSTARRFLFNYKYAKSQDDLTAGPAAKRLAFLSEIKEIIACSSASGYRFTYNDVNLLDEWSSTTKLPVHEEGKKRDLWGYSNDAATSKIPRIYINTSANKADRFSLIEPTPGAIPDLDGANRHVDPLTVDDGALASITYPNNVRLNIVYEPNSYYDTYLNKDVMVSGSNRLQFPEIRA
jgi:hypothetical protein